MPAIIAHRGASRAERENTVAAFRMAVALGADGIELDVRRTKDGVAVVHHDPACSDEQGKELVIATVAAAELPDYVPRLDQALNACEGAFVNIEIKNSAHEADCDPLRRICELVITALAGREISGWVISSFDRSVIDRIHELAPQLTTAWLVIEFGSKDLDALVADGHHGIHPWEQLLTADLVDAAHERGLFVNAWTCNDPNRMRDLFAWGVDGIVTDLPDLAATVLGRD